MATRPKPVSPTFGQTMRKLREDRGMTRRELEDATNLSQRQIEYLEKDEKEPKRSTLEVLAKALGPDILEAAFPGLIVLSSKERRTRAHLHAIPSLSPIQIELLTRRLKEASPVQAPLMSVVGP